MVVLNDDRNIPEAATEPETHQVPTAAAAMLRIRCNGSLSLSPHISWKGKRKRTSACDSSTRKSKRLERLEHFLESLVNNMMEKQENMHKQVIQMIQDKEKERVAKEEAWKQREMKRIARNEEVRAQQTSRSLALLNFVQNLLRDGVQVSLPAPRVAQPVAIGVPPSYYHGHQCVHGDIQVSQPAPVVAAIVPSSSNHDCLYVCGNVQAPQPAPHVAQPPATVIPPGFNHGHQCVCGNVQVPQLAPLVSQPLATAVPPGFNHNHQCVEETNYLHKDTEIVKCGATRTNNRWLKAEVHALIDLWTINFRSTERKGRHGLWEEISLGMKRMGYDCTTSKCKEKWDNITKYYKKAITSDKKRPESGTTCQYFDQLDLLFNSPKENTYTHKDKEIVQCGATPTGKGWLQAEVRELIALRASLEHKFCTPTDSDYYSVWEEISRGMNGLGYDRTGGSCREKWESMTKYLTSVEQFYEHTNTNRYFNQLMVLCETGLLSVESDSSPTSNLGNGYGFSCTSNQETKNDDEFQKYVLNSVDTSPLTCNAAIPSV